MISPPPASQYPDQHRIRFVSICKCSLFTFIRQFLLTSIECIVVCYLLFRAGADGQTLVWDVPALREGYTPLPTGDLAVSSMLPVARFRDSLGPGMTRQNISFDSETNLFHTCSGERRIR